MAKSKQPTFEDDLAALEEIVEALEEGELPLEESLKRFEDGIKLYRRCDKALTDAEKKIEILTKNASGELEARAFDETSGEPEEVAPGDANHSRTATDGAEEADGDPDEDGGRGLLF